MVVVLSFTQIPGNQIKGFKISRATTNWRIFLFTKCCSVILQRIISNQSRHPQYAMLKLIDTPVK